MVGEKAHRLGFKLSASAVKNSVYIPKYYDPDIAVRLQALSESFELVSVADLARGKYIQVETGHEIGKMAYGTGTIPFIRTSDISNWEIKTDPKQGVSQEIYEKYAQKQSIAPNDILFVRDGTYLIGQSCIVTEFDVPCLYQSHINRLRVDASSPISNWLLFAALNTPVVKRQIRAYQFTADIIDTIGNRFFELILPIPRDAGLAASVASEIRAIVSTRIKLRERIRKIPLLAQGLISHLTDEPKEAQLGEQRAGNLGFKIAASKLRSNILIPKYYDSLLYSDLMSLSSTHDLLDLGTLISQNILSWSTGIEVGKMAYGTGDIPFIRTSDITNWELKNDPKQNVSEEIYESNKQDVKAGDIFIVSDGTYLIGTTCIITPQDTRILYCGGIDRLRVEKEEQLNPYLLLALLNTPIVQRQIRAKQFTRDIIDTLSRRLLEIVLPIPKDKRLRDFVSEETRHVIEERVNLRYRARKVSLYAEN